MRLFPFSEKWMGRPPMAEPLGDEMPILGALERAMAHLPPPPSLPWIRPGLHYKKKYTHKHTGRRMFIRCRHQPATLRFTVLKTRGFTN